MRNKVVQHNTVAETFNRVVKMTAEKAALFGFSRSGVVLRKISGGNSAIVEFQRSTKSSKERILFTVNLGVICGPLLEPDEPTLIKARSMNAHLQERIGMMFPGYPDKWWEITQDTDDVALAVEVSELVRAKVIPYLEQYLDTSELVALWKSGKSPGLTEKQRDRYLAKLTTGVGGGL